LALHTLDTLQLSRENHQANDAPVESLLPLRHFVVPSSTINRSNETRIPVILSEQVCDKDKSKSLLFWDAAGLGSAEKQGKRQISFGAFSGHRENRHVYGRIIFSMPRTRGEPNNDAKRREIINGCRNYVGFQSPISLDFDRSEQIRPGLIAVDINRERERERERSDQFLSIRGENSRKLVNSWRAFRSSETFRFCSALLFSAGSSFPAIFLSVYLRGKMSDIHLSAARPKAASRFFFGRANRPAIVA